MIGNPNANLPTNREGFRDVSENASVHGFPVFSGEAVQHPKSNGWCSHLNGNMRRQFT